MKNEGWKSLHNPPEVRKDGDDHVILSFERGELRMTKEAATGLGWELLEACGVDAHA